MNILNIDIFDQDVDALLDEDFGDIDFSLEGIFYHGFGARIGQPRWTRTSRITDTVKAAKVKIKRYQKRLDKKGFKDLTGIQVAVPTARVLIPQITRCKKLIDQLSNYSAKDLQYSSFKRYKKDLEFLNISTVDYFKFKNVKTKNKKINLLENGWSTENITKAFGDIYDIEKFIQNIDGKAKTLKKEVKDHKGPFAVYTNLMFSLLKEYLVLTRDVLRLVKATRR